MTTVSTSAEAVAAGWSFPAAGVGSTSAWYAEKTVQKGGKLVCASSSSAELVTAISSCEYYQANLGANSPENAGFNG